MTLMENRHNERLITTVTSSVTSIEKLQTQYKRVLDKLSDQVRLPYGVVLEGRMTNDSFNNWSLTVFLRKGDEVFPLADPRHTSNYIEETVGGRWVRMTKDGEPFYGYESEARDLGRAIAKLREAGEL